MQGHGICRMVLRLQACGILGSLRHIYDGQQRGELEPYVIYRENGFE